MLMYTSAFSHTITSWFMISSRIPSHSFIYIVATNIYSIKIRKCARPARSISPLFFSLENMTRTTPNWSLNWDVFFLLLLEAEKINMRIILLIASNKWIHFGDLPFNLHMFPLQCFFFIYSRFTFNRFNYSLAVDWKKMASFVNWDNIVGMKNGIKKNPQHIQIANRYKKKW